MVRFSESCSFGKQETQNWMSSTREVFLCFVFVFKENRLKNKSEEEFTLAEADHSLCPYLLTTLLLWEDPH